MKVEFEWRISDPINGVVYVMERLVGHDKINQFGPMPQHIANSFVRARRNFISQNIHKKYQAVQLFEPRTPIILKQGEYVEPEDDVVENYDVED